MLLEKLLKGFNYSTSTFNLKESKLFDQYFERILISKGTFLVKEGEIERYSYFVFDGILRCWLTTVQRNYPIGSVDLNRNHSSDVLV